MTPRNDQPQQERAPIGFHWSHGWHFRRLSDGAVVIYHADAPEISAIGPISPDEWASIVHATAKPGASFYAIRTALGVEP